MPIEYLGSGMEFHTALQSYNVEYSLYIWFSNLSTLLNSEAMLHTCVYEINLLRKLRNFSNKKYFPKNTKQMQVPFYTERQKKLITSLECHPLKSKASTWIIFGHRLGKFIHKKHIAKNKSLL